MAFAVADADLDEGRTRLESQGVEVLRRSPGKEERVASISEILTAIYSNWPRRRFGVSIGDVPNVFREVSDPCPTRQEVGVSKSSTARINVTQGLSTP